MTKVCVAGCKALQLSLWRVAVEFVACCGWVMVVMRGKAIPLRRLGVSGGDYRGGLVEDASKAILSTWKIYKALL